MKTIQLRPVCAAIIILCAGAPAFAQDANGGTAQNAPGANESQNARAAADQEAANAVASPAAPTQPAQQSPQMQQITVTGLRSSIRSAEAIKRNSMQVVDSINSEDIGKFPDRAAGDALQRIAGVQVQRDRGETNSVIIRGLPDVVTTLNGMEYFTGNGRRLSYQDLPVESIGGLDVYKTATPNQLEGGIAGGVDVRLRMPFDLKGFNASGMVEDRRQTVNGSSATDKKNNPGGAFSVSNRWNTSYGEMGALLDVAFNREHWGYPVQWDDRPVNVYAVNPATGVGLRHTETPLGPLPAGNVWGEFPNVGGIYNAGDRDRGSIHGALQWKVNPTLVADVQYLGTGYRGRNAVDYMIANSTWTPTITNVKLAPGGCNTPEGVICPILSANHPAAPFGGPYDWDPYVATSTQAQKEHTVTHFLSQGLNYREGPWKASSNLAWVKSTFVNDTVIVDQQVPQATADIYTYGADGHGGYNSVTTPTSSTPLRDPNQFVLRGLSQNWTVTKGEQVQWRGDVSYRLGDGFFEGIDAGGRLSEHRASAHSAQGNNDFSGTRPNPVTALGSGFETLSPGLDRLGGPWMTPSRDYLIDQADTVRALYGAPLGRLPEDPTRFFQESEQTSTLYAAARFKTQVSSVDVSGTAGVRYVHVNRSLQGNSRIGDVISPIDTSSSENNILPSASVIVGWTERLQSHVSAGKTITRPDFASLNPALSLNPATVNAPGTGSAGNPDLRPTTSKNFDATLEYYFPKNGYAQIAVFHRDIDGYLQNMETSESINGQSYRVTRPQNSGSGKLKGAELGVQKFFDFLPGPWSNFGAQFNYTWIDGENQTLTSPTSGVYTTTALTNVAKQNYNFALLYEGNGITGRLTATHRGDYVEQIAEPRFGQDRTVKATTFVDLSVSYAITPKISLQLDAINLTHQKFESELGPYEPRDVRYNPTTYGVGLRFSL
jgi:iron complex outermembrane receptor protein